MPSVVASGRKNGNLSQGARSYVLLVVANMTEIILSFCHITSKDFQNEEVLGCVDKERSNFSVNYTTIPHCFIHSSPNIYFTLWAKTVFPSHQLK